MSTPPAITTALHRVRFADYHPSPITAISFTPIPFPSPDPEIAEKKAQQDALSKKEEMAALVVARQNGEVQIWEYATNEAREEVGSWVLRRVLPAVLAYPTISLMTLAIRDPEDFYASASPSSNPSTSSSSSSSRQKRLPSLEELRLFTAGSDSGDLIERCLFTGAILQTTPLPSGPIWSLSLSPTHTHLAISTSAPHIHLLSLSSSSPELNIATLVSSGAGGAVGRMEALPGRVRTLGIAWGAPVRQRVESQGKTIDDDAEEKTRSDWVWKLTHLITAHSDSSLRKYNLSTGRVVGRMSVGKLRSVEKGGKGRKRHSVVWAVACLADGTIISADSLGTVTFWDGKSLAQIKAFKAHAADALCLIVSPNGKAIYSSGPDQRVTQFSFVPSSSSTAAEDDMAETSRSISGEWQQTSTKRLHKHDVRALAMFPSYSLAPRSSLAPLNPGVAPVLASGGLDMSLVLTSAAQSEGVSKKSNKEQSLVKNPLTKKGKEVFSDAVKVDLGYVPRGYGNDVISIAREKKLVLVRRYRGIALFRIRDMIRRGEEVDGESVPGGWDKVLEMDFQLRSSLTAAAISPDGQWLAVSDLYETKVFKLKYREGDDDDSIVAHPRRIRLFTGTLLSELERLGDMAVYKRGTGASSLAFTPDSNALIIGLAMHSHMVIVEVGDEDADEGVSVLQSLPIPVKEGMRAVRGLPTRSRANKKPNGVTNGNGHATDNSNGDASMEDSDGDAGSEPGANGIDDDSDSESESEEEDSDDPARPRLVMMTISRDGQWLACQDSLGRIGIWSLDVLKLHCFVPTFAQPPSAMAFTNASTLVFAFPGSNSIQQFDVDDRRLLPERTKVTYTDERVLGLEAIPSSSSSGKGKLLAWGSNWVSSLEVPSGDASSKDKKAKKRRKSKANETAESKAEEKAQLMEDEPFKIIGRYREVSAVSMVDGDLVVVERPFTDLTGLPTAFVKPKYNT